MTQHRRRLEAIPALDDFEIGVANAAGERLDEHVLVMERGHFNFFDAERLAGFVQDSSLHWTPFLLNSPADRNKGYSYRPIRCDVPAGFDRRARCAISVQGDVFRLNLSKAKTDLICRQLAGGYSGSGMVRRHRDVG